MLINMVWEVFGFGAGASGGRREAPYVASSLKWLFLLHLAVLVYGKFSMKGSPGIELGWVLPEHDFLEL